MTASFLASPMLAIAPGRPAAPRTCSRLYSEASAPVPSSLAPGKLHCSWRNIESLVGELAQKIPTGAADVVLAITRGGTIPATLLCEIMERRTLLTASVMLYNDAGSRFYGLDQPSILHFPEDILLRGRNVLIVDDVWDSGRTALVVRERCRRAQAASVQVAVLHYKPTASLSGERPDFYVNQTQQWVVYPWERLAPTADQDKAGENTPDPIQA